MNARRIVSWRTLTIVWPGIAAGLAGSLSAVHADDAQCRPASRTLLPLDRYVQRPDTEFSWKLAGTVSTPGGTVYSLDVVSQKWQGILWHHAVRVYEPDTVEHANHMLVFVTGGNNGRDPNPSDMVFGLYLAKLCRARVAMLHQVPNQPLFGGRREDDLITETWLRYLKTGDENWPLLFPMVKSVARTMDALEQFAARQWKQKIGGFVVSGASKRGWTSWLTGATDKRVVAIAPIVIDVLNFPRQMKHQKDTWGKYSEQIVDYTSKGLVRESGVPKTEREKLLWQMMDPISYRKRLSLPKLLIVGTNDRYWVVDAMNLYWDDLPGAKFVLQVPNAGHNLKGGRGKVVRTLAAFFQANVAKTKKVPRLAWKYKKQDGSMRLTATADPQPKTVRLWTADATDKDFREARWSSRNVEIEGGNFTAEVKLPESGHRAMFAEFVYGERGTEYSLTTLVFRE